MGKIISKPYKGDENWPFPEPEKLEAGRHIRIQGKWVNERDLPVYNAPPRMMIISDTMPYQQHQLTGKGTDSRSAHKRMTKEYDSVYGTKHEYRNGDQRVADNVPKFKEMETSDYEREVAIAREQLLAGTAPLTDLDKEVCKNIDERIKNRV